MITELELLDKARAGGPRPSREMSWNAWTFSETWFPAWMLGLWPGQLGAVEWHCIRVVFLRFNAGLSRVLSRQTIDGVDDLI